MQGYCLPSQDIRKKIKDGNILGVTYTDDTEKRIQTNSYDPVIGDVCYWIDDEIPTYLRSNPSITIAQALDNVPSDQKRMFDIKEGFQLSVGHSYLFPLKESIVLEEDEYVKISPKSSSGRTFTDVRCFADRNPGFDLVHPRYCGKNPVQLWILVQPRAFNLIVKPNMSFNQLRFIKGVGARLTRSDIEAEFKKKPFIFSRKGDTEELKPLNNPFFSEDGFIMHLCLHSRNAKNKLVHLEVKPNDCLLLFTQEVVHVPRQLNGEMRAYSLASIRGPLHFAGFFDNNFLGDAVLEVVSEEKGTVLLNHGSPIVEFEFYRTRDIPDKVYGDEESNSNYFGQIGPKLAKFFQPMDLSGVVGLRAKKTPLPIDLSKKHAHDPLDFFDII